jgi:hypothetical protein
MKQHSDYIFWIKFKGHEFVCKVEGANVSIESKGIIEETEYEVLRNYLEDEGFIQEIDRRKGILNLFK